MSDTRGDGLSDLWVNKAPTEVARMNYEEYIRYLHPRLIYMTEKLPFSNYDLKEDFLEELGKLANQAFMDGVAIGRKMETKE